MSILFGMVLALCFLLSRLTLAPIHSPAESQVIKGIWLSHVGNAWLTYTTQTDNAFHQLSRLNYNRVYVDVYNDGTTYPSKYAPRNYLLSAPLTNPLKQAIAQGKRQGLKVYAWYEHGMMTFPQAKLAIQHPEWILTTNDNERLIDNHWWLDPTNAEVQDYFINLLTEVAQNYPDLYGIQVDDHWGIPVQFGDYTQAMTELTTKVVAAVKKIRPDLVMSLSPNPLGFSRKKYAQDWLTWIDAGLIDELVMQLYRPTTAEVALSMDNSLLAQISKNIDVAVGIYAGGLQGQKPLEEIQRQILIVKEYGYGYALFPWKTSLGILRSNHRQEKEQYLEAI
ncbi:MAG: family 10 glycosylhydrolase [Cyanobacteria bacterium J06629_2]